MVKPQLFPAPALLEMFVCFLRCSLGQDELQRALDWERAAINGLGNMALDLRNQRPSELANRLWRPWWEPQSRITIAKNTLDSAKL
jgi:hypothetical protein